MNMVWSQGRNWLVNCQWAFLVWEYYDICFENYLDNRFSFYSFIYFSRSYESFQKHGCPHWTRRTIKLECSLDNLKNKKKNEMCAVSAPKSDWFLFLNFVNLFFVLHSCTYLLLLYFFFFFGCHVLEFSFHFICGIFILILIVFHIFNTLLY